MGIGVSQSLWLVTPGLEWRMGIGSSSLASLRPQSPYSSIHLRVSDIFHGWEVLYILVELALHVVAS